MKTVTEIKTAIIDSLKHIKIANGYATDLSDSRIFGFYSPEIADDELDASFPQAFVVPVTGEFEYAPGGQMHRTNHFAIFLFVKQQQTTDPVTLTEKFIGDVERCLSERAHLNGTVNGCEVIEYVMDSGVMAPRGAAILRVRTLVTQF